MLNQARPDSVLLPRLVHGLRVLLLVAILVVVRYANQKPADAIYDLSSDPTAVAFARSAFETDGEIQIRPSTTAGRWEVVAEPSKGTKVGDLIRTSPQSDDITGFSGPTDCLVALGSNQQIVSVGIFNSRDTVEHVDLIQESPDFFASFSRAAGVGQKPLLAKTRDWGSYGADFITIGLVLIGVVFSFTKLSKRRWLRIGYQIAVVMVLGFYSGHMLSQASVAGWAANTLPWQVAPGLVFLSLAAIAVPMFSKHQPYCQHICPFGAMQQWARTPLVKRIIRWNVAIDARLAKLLRCLPIVLLATVIVTATSGSVFNLASIEPFDGFGLRVAGWATIAIFVVGLLLSFVSPMAYCRFGCPTGVMLGYLRFRGDSHRLGLRDFVAVCLLLLALYVLTK